MMIFSAQGNGSVLAKSTAPIVLMYGQSNCKGFAPMSGLQAQYQQTFSNIKTWTGSAFESLNYSTNNNQWPEQDNCFGPEFSLMTRLQQYYNGVVYFSKPSFNGCGLAQGSGASGDLTPGLSSSKYPQSAALWSRAIAHLNTSNVVAFVYIQGEADAKAPYAASYQANLELMYTNVKAVLNKPNLPIIICGLRTDVDATVCPLASTIRAAQTSFVAAGSNRYFLSPNSWTLQGDNIHYDASGIEAMGVDIYNCGINNSLWT